MYSHRSRADWGVRAYSVRPEARCSQYSAGASRHLLARYGWQQSMSAVGYCYDNAFAESFFATIKAEILPDDGIFDSKTIARTAIFDYIECFYNPKRLHSALNFLSPVDFEAINN